MQAAMHRTYGTPDVIEITDIAAPTPGPEQILVRVCATPVTYGDRRLRAADFPGISWLPGRLMMGMLRPKNPILGTAFAGRVVAVGEAVTRFAVGDDVFGACPHGGAAELLAVQADGPVAPMPAGLDYEEAAALPYGGTTALIFLRDLAAVKPGERVCIVGAAGGVGRFAVQVARHFGAEVTAVCRARDFEMVRALGATEVIDYTAEDFTAGERRWDVVFDTSNQHGYRRSRRALRPGGRFMTLHMSLGILFFAALTAVFGGARGRKAKFGMAFGTADDTAQVAALAAEGAIRPRVARRLPLARMAEAHRLAEAGVGGEVIVTVPAARAVPAGVAA